MKFVKNMSNLDRIIRIVAGTFLVYLGFLYGELTGHAFLDIFIGIIGIMNIVAGIVASCPMYLLVGISSCKHSK